MSFLLSQFKQYSDALKTMGGGVYSIVNKLTGPIYFGSTNNFFIRLGQHIAAVLRGT